MSSFNNAWVARYKARELFHRSAEEVRVEYQRFKEDWVTEPWWQWSLKKDAYCFREVPVIYLKRFSARIGDANVGGAE